jgi:HEAT repeat protein
MHEQKIIILVSISAALLFFIAALFLASVARRVHHKAKYRQLDGLRAFYEKKILKDLNSGSRDIPFEEYRTVPGSLRWQALEDVLFSLMDEERYRAQVKRLFSGIGYSAFYEQQLANGNKVVLESAIDKLGRMESESSARKLLPLLDGTDPELLSVVVRALSKLGTREGLAQVAEKLPRLVGQSLVARKALETALLNFGPAAVPVLIEQHGGSADPPVLSLVLEVLSHFPPETRAVFLAAEHLENPDPEVRSRALRVLARAGKNLPDHLSSLVLPLLGDPVWFVRLQAIKAATTLRCEQAAAPLGKLLFDSNWQVRGEAALVLTGLGDCAVDVFHDALTLYDAYAKTGVCEELERAGFTSRLIENLSGADRELRVKSREILAIMRALGFTASLTRYLESGQDEGARRAAREILERGDGQ